MNDSDVEFPLLKEQGLYAAQITGDGNCLFRALADQLYGDPERFRQIRRDIVQFLREHKARFISFLPASGEVGHHGRKSARLANNRESRGSLKSIANDKNIDRLWEQYLDTMSKDGVYGDNLEIVAFAKRFNVDVKIHLSDFAYVVSGEQDKEDDSSPESDGKDDSRASDKLGSGRKTASSSNNKRRVLHIAYHLWEHYSSIRNINGPHTGLPNVEEYDISQDQANLLLSSHEYFQPWMENVVLSSIPELEGDTKIIRDTIEKFKGDINKTVEYLFENQYQHDEDLYNFEPLAISNEPTMADIDRQVSSTLTQEPIELSMKDEEITQKQIENQSASTKSTSLLSVTTSNNKHNMTSNTSINGKSRPRKETARERKERQKKESKERRKNEQQSQASRQNPNINVVASKVVYI
ncbi:hypothetical protein V1511DRAFT_510330 [Dipodascopsis uninucleata]